VLFLHVIIIVSTEIVTVNKKKCTQPFSPIIAQSMLYNPFYNTLNHHMSFPLTFLADE